MSKTIVVGITGLARSGKDTFASQLADELHKQADTAVAQVASFAGPLKSMLAQILLPLCGNDMTLVHALMYSDMKDEHFEPLGTSPRRALQTLGTEWGRHTIKETIWLDVMKAQIEMVGKQQRFQDATLRVVIIADTRFENEAEICDYVFGIEREGVERGDTHLSEGGVPERLVHSRIENNGSYTELRDIASGVAKLIAQGQEDECTAA